MFGYTTPFVCELKVGEHNLYKAIYCGLCRTLKKNYSNLCSLFLSYDLVFFTILAIIFLNDNIEFEKKFCPITPFKKKICLKQCKSLDLACSLAIILSYFKLQDQIHDENLIKKIGFRIIKLFLKRHFKKASKQQQNFFKYVKNLYILQQKLEKKTYSSIDMACHPTAECLSLIFNSLSEHEETKNNLKKFGYLLGRFIYLIDAIDDIDHDFKLKNYNPFLIKYKNIQSTKFLNDVEKKMIFKNAYQIINFTLAQLIESYKRLKIVKLKPITDNIIYLGLKASQKRIFKKHNELEIFKLYSSENNINN